MEVLNTDAEVVETEPRDCPFVPEAICNMMSSKKIVKNGLEVILRENNGSIIHVESGVDIMAHKIDGFHYLDNIENI